MVKYRFPRLRRFRRMGGGKTLSCGRNEGDPRKSVPAIPLGW